MQTVSIKTPQEIGTMAHGGQRLAKIIKRVSQLAKPGLTLQSLDQRAELMVADYQLQPSFKGFKGYPAVSCLSVNDAIVHGLPSNYRLREGDLLGIDLGVQYQGLNTDAAITMIVSNQNPEQAIKTYPEKHRLIEVTRQCLEAAIRVVRPGVAIRRLAETVQTIAEQNGYHVIRELTGHGIGRSPHEEPRVPNFVGTPADAIQLKEGMVICIEPMLCSIPGRVRTDADGWTVRVPPGGLSAHFEHTVAVVRNGHRVLTTD